MTRNRALLAAAALLLAAVIGGGVVYATTSDDTTPVAATAPSPTRNAATEVECASITRAHNAWDSPSRAKSSPDFTALGQFQMQQEADAATEYGKAISGYDSQASKTLAVAVTSLAMELSIANASLVAGLGVDSEQAVKLQSAITQVGRDYDAWRSATCA